ncbi:hypothetical protein LTR85_006855 [Meristemomyces frigidus]|nr:hypothetical protein LTR85_006855 [Meristemomyces frigidus]
MVFNCFRASSGNSLSQELDEAARPHSANNDRPGPRHAKTKSRILRRHGSADSRSSSASNESISKLPPCKRSSDPKIEALMMQVPPEPRPSRCLRLSQPKTYSNIVDSMKASKGCRDWRNFAVFHVDEVDMSMSAEDVARRRARDYERKVRQLNSFSTDSDNPRQIATEQSPPFNNITTNSTHQPKHSSPIPNEPDNPAAGRRSLSLTAEACHSLSITSTARRTALHKHFKVASATTITTERVESVTTQAQQKAIVPHKPSQQRSDQRAHAENEAHQQDQQPARPYLKLLMPEPAPDQPCDTELRKEDCRYYFYVLSRGFRNKDWKTRPVFDETDDEDDEPLSPLFSQIEGKVEVKQDAEGTKVVIDGEEMVDMIG